MECLWERYKSREVSLDCNKEQMEGKYCNNGQNKQKNLEDDYKGIQYRSCHYSIIQIRM